MTLEELMSRTNDEVNVTVYGRSGEGIAKYDGRDSIPAVLNGAEVFEFRVTDANTLTVKLDYSDSTQAIDYLKARLEDITEFIACDDGYRFDNEYTIKQYIAQELDNVISDIREVQYNLSRGLDWNDGIDEE